VSRYGGAVSHAGINTADSVYAQVRATTTNARLYVVKAWIAISVAPTTAPLFYLTRGATAGTTPTITLLGQGYDPADGAANGQVEGATWATPPTKTAANKLDGGALAATAGGLWLWTFYDRPLVVDRVTTTPLCICNANASGASTGTFVSGFAWDE
jgi:hypothetical protein